MPEVLLLIPARGGSKSIPRKNLAALGGRPLIEWAIAAALAAKIPADVAVSSDDTEILDVASHAGISRLIHRPAALATDEATSVAAALHALDTLEKTYSVVALVQPTSPFVHAADIDGCIALGLQDSPCSAATVARSASSPYWSYRVDESGRLQPVTEGKRPRRRQDAPTTFHLNGAVFVASREFLELHGDFVAPGTRAYIMPDERSIDIDDTLDLEFASFLAQRPKGS